MRNKGLVIIFTGNGKGKTTAALGMLLRSAGQNLKICVIQFIKKPEIPTGESMAGELLGFEWHTCGDGFTWLSRDLNKTIQLAQNGWKLARSKILTKDYDLIVLDEFTYPINEGWISCAEVIYWLKKNKPPSLHLVITGRNAPDEIIEYADTVTEMKLVKHHFDQGICAQAGIEF